MSVPDTARHGDVHRDDMTAYLLLEATLCECSDERGDETCTCGWDDCEGGRNETDIIQG